MFWDFDDWDLDIEDMAIYGGIAGLFEEEYEEEERRRKQLEGELETEFEDSDLP